MKQYKIVRVEREGDIALPLTEEQIERLARPIVGFYDRIVKFYEDPKNVEGYRQWYYKKYGEYPTDV